MRQAVAVQPRNMERSHIDSVGSVRFTSALNIALVHIDSVRSVRRQHIPPVSCYMVKPKQIVAGISDV